jgi:hypothetical protein
MQEDINKMLGQTGTPNESNPLEKIEQASKDASKKPEESKEGLENFDDETFNQILMAGDNTEGLFTPNEDKEQEKEDPKHSEVHEDAKVKQIKIDKAKGKYAQKFKEDVLKNPSQYKVKTPKGEMSIAEAMKKGYNPITKRFEKDKDSEKIKKKHLEGLNDSDRAKLEEITSPSAARIAPKDAQARGMSADNPMIAGNRPQATPPQTAQPQAAPVPEQPGQAGPSPEGMDINSMLGGM